MTKVSTKERLAMDGEVHDGAYEVDEARDSPGECGWTQQKLDSYWLGEGLPDDPVWIDSRAFAGR